MAARADSTTLLLARVQRRIRRELEQAMAAEGITYARYSALSVVANEPGLSSADLARRSHTTRQAMNQTVTGLVREGLVATTRDRDNARIQRLHVTDAGAELLSRGDEAVARVESTVLVRLDPGERRQLTALLELLGEPPLDSSA